VKTNKELKEIIVDLTAQLQRKNQEIEALKNKSKGEVKQNG
jgi:hypothetical protein